MMDAISSTGSRTRGYLPSASRLSDAHFLVIREDFVKLAAMKNRLEEEKRQCSPLPNIFLRFLYKQYMLSGKPSGRREVE